MSSTSRPFFSKMPRVMATGTGARHTALAFQASLIGRSLLAASTWLAPTPATADRPSAPTERNRRRREGRMIEDAEAWRGVVMGNLSVGAGRAGHGTGRRRRCWGRFDRNHSRHGNNKTGHAYEEVAKHAATHCAPIQDAPEAAPPCTLISSPRSP